MDKSSTATPAVAPGVNVRLADVLRPRIADLLEAWRHALGAGTPGASAQQPRLAGYVEGLLERLGQPQEPGQLDAFQGPPPDVLGRELAEEGVLSEVLREYAELRRCLTGALLQAPVPPAPAELVWVHQVLDAEVAAVVALHVTSRQQRDEAVGARRLRELEARYLRERHLEEDLARSEERFRAVFEFAAIGIALADVRGRFLRANRALQELVGYSEAELRQLTIPDLTPAEDMARERILFQELLEGQRSPYRIERRIIRRDGSIGWCRLTVSLGRSDRDLPPFIIGMVEDLSERKRAEELERTAEFRERFLGVLGHDLRTPLNAIGLSAHRLLKLDLPEEGMGTVRRIQASAERMGRMIGDLLDVARSRLGSGIPVFRAPMDLGDAARAAVDELASAFPGRTIRCELSGPVEGEWDPDRMAQVFTNLLSNALQYSPPDTEVRVEVRAEGRWAELSVHNTGPAIPPEFHHDLFEPFRRAGQRDSRSGNLGLGLFIVSQIVRAHRGEVSVRSTAEEGTTFTVRLPRRRGSAEDGEDSPPT